MHAIELAWHSNQNVAKAPGTVRPYGQLRRRDAGGWRHECGIDDSAANFAVVRHLT